MRARTPVQRRQTPALHQPDLQRQTWQRRQCNASNEDSSTLAITPAQCGQGRQRDAKENAIAALARLPKAKSPWTNAIYSIEATGNDNECGNDAPAKCNGQMPVCDSGINASVTRVMTPAQRGQRCQRNAGNNNGTMLTMTPVRVASTALAKMSTLHWSDH
jgi:hypothetical protein